MMKRLGIAPIADTLMKVPVREKGEGMPSTNVYHENAVHQADLLFLPHDKVGRLRWILHFTLPILNSIV